jgi:hypothetical protein
MEQERISVQIEINEELESKLRKKQKRILPPCKESENENQEFMIWIIQ